MFSTQAAALGAVSVYADPLGGGGNNVRGGFRQLAPLVKLAPAGLRAHTAGGDSAPLDQGRAPEAVGTGPRYRKACLTRRDEYDIGPRHRKHPRAAWPALLNIFYIEESYGDRSFRDRLHSIKCPPSSRWGVQIILSLPGSHATSPQPSRPQIRW
ncbi:hypothetical protein [Rhodococcus sp. 24CO]|uniref:hypothetical protein n=1 Tax=Rhodococcus sp. 24CO TaxID=3117460 RepID=UPI003D32FB11